jgi:hypothetical protein
MDAVRERVDPLRDGAVEDVVALALRHDEACGGELPQVLRQTGFRDPDERRELLGRPRRFRIVVRDRSARHNFRLAGRGVNRTTGADFRGSVTWRVRPAKGTYRFGSDARKLPGRLRVR